jgi:tRNA G18 (ribose-2'-O)-methylase SpoU
MGVICYMPVLQLPWKEVTDFVLQMVQQAKQKTQVVLLTVENGIDKPTAYDALDFTQSSIVVVGSEAHGLGEEALELQKKIKKSATVATATIPMLRSLESFNAAAAGAVVMSEVGRQRRRQAESK